jgi:hypothetical protein
MCCWYLGHIDFCPVTTTLPKCTYTLPLWSDTLVIPSNRIIKVRETPP